MPPTYSATVCPVSEVLLLYDGKTDVGGKGNAKAQEDLEGQEVIDDSDRTDLLIPSGRLQN